MVWCGSCLQVFLCGDWVPSNVRLRWGSLYVVRSTGQCYIMEHRPYEVIAVGLFTAGPVKMGSYARSGLDIRSPASCFPLHHAFYSTICFHHDAICHVSAEPEATLSQEMPAVYSQTSRTAGGITLFSKCTSLTTAVQTESVTVKEAPRILWPMKSWQIVPMYLSPGYRTCSVSKQLDLEYQNSGAHESSLGLLLTCLLSLASYSEWLSFPHLLRWHKSNSVVAHFPKVHSLVYQFLNDALGWEQGKEKFHNLFLLNTLPTMCHPRTFKMPDSVWGSSS